MKRANFLNFTLKAIDWETTLGSGVKWMAGVGGVRFAPLMSCCFITGSNYSWYRIRIWFNKKIKMYTELYDAFIFKGLLGGLTVCYLEYIHSLLFYFNIFFCACLPSICKYSLLPYIKTCQISCLAISKTMEIEVLKIRRVNYRWSMQGLNYWSV